VKLHTKNATEKSQGMVMGAISVYLFFIMTSALSAESQETWNCEETAYYSVYEDISRTESKATPNTKTLKWNDTNTIGFEAISFMRINPSSETFFNLSSGSVLQINQTERPYFLVLTQPQVWMNKFGNLRVRFYRCTP
jgi:hypothetical protein